MARGFIDGVGYGNKGGLMTGFDVGMQLAKQRQAEEDRQKAEAMRAGLASGFSDYLNAQDDNARNMALGRIAQQDPSTAISMYNKIQEMNQKNQITPYQQAQLDLQREEKERQNKLYQMNVDKYEEEKLLRNEAKEKEQMLGDALYRYQTAQTDEDKNIALADVYKISPDFAKDILKKQKEAEKKGYGNSELGLMIDVKMHPENYSQDVVDYVNSYSKVKTKDPSLRGLNEYEGTIGKQYAEAGMPYGGVNAQVQGDPVQAQPIPTAAQLAADKKRAEKQAENMVEQEKNAKVAKQSVDTLDDTIKFVEDAPDDVFSPLGDIYQKAGVLTGGLVGYDKDEQAVRGEIMRRIGIEQNNILAEARSKGQTGINTMAEVRQATKGLSENSGKPALLSTLRYMKKLKENLAKAPDVEAVETPEEEVISWEDWMK